MSRLHRHRGSPEPHSVADHHMTDPEASVAHYTEVNHWRRRHGHRPRWASENRPGRAGLCRTRERVGATPG